ncbi:type I polyketide synthase [Actinomadura sp. 9N215]|uniref:type I polyketide synthase n=1 Tax=Actinomadura sp. 9N215 TaxID=3375150 RepID=UPI00379FE678
MSDNEEKLLDYLKRVTADLRRTQRRLKDVESADHEPVAIIGMACRLPGGVRSPADLWELVASGRDAVGALPADRGWDLDALHVPDPRDPGTVRAPEGGFLYDAADFDAAFFGISPREALGMAPQQRLALEVSWEAIEHARLDPTSLRGTLTSTFIGCDHLDYVEDVAQVPDGSAGYFTIGNTASVVSGRVAYALGLEGAAVTVDTACSSSLVALHLACQALRRGECTAALAGGVAVMSSSAPFIGFSDLGALAPDGRSRAFSADSDGMTLSEGVGVLLLERLSDARRNGHRVLAVVRGSAVNQDGTSNGLTAPNGPAQQRVIQQALADARLAPSDVDAVEAHGTGTTLGDPIEAQALLATYGQDRPDDRPLWLGSIKSNIGHTQMAAGAASVIKVVEALRHETLPATLHVSEPTPHVDWSSGAVRLLTEPEAWPERERPRRAGVSSFGISGTNAHVIVESVPAPDAAEPARVDGPVPWVLSARTPQALRDQARALADLDAPDIAGVARALVETRATFEHRTVVLGRSPQELRTGLLEVAQQDDLPAVPGTADAGPLVWLFPGQGSQRPGMGAGLYDRYPVFAATFDQVCALLDPHLPEHPLKQVVFEGEPGGLLDHTTYAQAALFALQTALARLLNDHGLHPDVVIGHSIGEITAAHIAGVLDLSDACRLVAARATLMGALPPGGAMATIHATPDELTQPPGLPDQVSIAAHNTPTTTVISGPAPHITTLTTHWANQGRKTRTLTTSHAFHSPLMDPILDDFETAIRDLTYHPPAIPLISTLTGQPATSDIATPHYWVRQVRQPVQFHHALTHTDPNPTFLELGADPTLTTAVQHTLDQPTTITTLTAKRPDTDAYLHALAHLHTTGTPINWTHHLPTTTHTTTDLPTYPFQHQRYWLELAPKVAQGSAETELWDAIESLDVEALTATLRTDDSQTIDTLRPALPILANWRQRQREQTTIDNWRYHIHWTPLPDPTPPHLDGTWLVLAPKGHSDHPAVQTTIQALEDHGATALLADTPAPSDTPLSGIISLLALDETPHPDHPAIPTGLAATIELLQNHHHTTPLWCLTTGAVNAAPTDTLPHPAQAHLWGLGRVAALEHPHQWRGLIDLPTTLDHHTPNRLAALLTDQHHPEDQLAIRATGTLTRRLARAPQRLAPTTWRPEGTTLITGGTGGLGAHIARWLTANNAPHIILASRQGPNAPGANELQTELGDTVTITTCDVSDRDALRDLIDQIPEERPLTTVIHAAGVVENDPIDELDNTLIERVLRPKALAAGHLHELTRDLDQLKTFVLFSSNAATWGSGRQASYAAANAYLDALAEHRRAQGLPATSIAWGPWSGEGMAADEETLDYLARRGLLPLDPDLAIRALEQALSHNDATVTIANLDWEKFPTAFTAQRPSPLLDELVAPPETPGTDTDAADGGDNALRNRLASQTSDQQIATLLEHVQARTAAVLGHDSVEEISSARPFQEIGFDSLTAVELRNRLAASTGLGLPPTLVFDHPTPKALAAHLQAELSGRRQAVTGHVTVAAVDDEPIAIIGMACRFPGGARSPQALWNLVASGHDAISEWPTDRGWNPHTHYNPDPEHRGTSYTRHGGFLHDAAHFDAAFFGISPREALAMDPQQRLLLETAWETIENAGINHTTLQGTNTGIYAGGTFQGYGAAALGSGSDESEGYLLAGGTTSVLSGRVAYALGLEGAAVTVDTACSSSLVAIHLAAQALRNGECSLALAGGVAVMSTPATFVEFSRQRGLAADGRCKPFAAAADGTGWGEGAGLVLLERLSDARRNGHRVLAVVRGSAVNQDGTSNGLTAPNGPSQQRVIQQALANARLSPSDVDAVEAHGTGTTLGDPIEAQALLATYGQNRDRPLWLGSIKSNIGHTQAAAGIAGVIKMVMAMRHGRLPTTLHVDEPSPHVDWSSGAVRLLTEPVDWPENGHPRRAGVSSFGISGTNAHVIVESVPDPEPIEPPEPIELDGPVPWVLSARTPQALRDQARALADLDAPDIAGVARALVDTRATFEHRAVVFGRTHQQLRTRLAELTEAPDTPAASTGPLVWLFPGQGSQRPGMGAGLYDRYPVFAAAFDEVCALLDPHLPHPLKQVVFEGEPGGLLDHTTYAQAALFALQTALARLLNDHGVHPDVVIGHSIGEITAAHIAGVLDLDDACRLVAARATLMGALPDGGAMATIHATPDELTQPPGLPDQVSIAAHNTPTTTVISGPAPHITTLTTHWANQGRKTRTLTTSHAFHSPLMDPILNDFETAIGDLTYRPPVIPLISTLTGRPAASDIATPDYWVRQVRQPVQFHHALTHTDPNPTFLELGADPTLTTAVQHTLDQPTTITTLTSKRSDTDAYLHALGHLHSTGTPINWAPFLPAFTHLAAIELPSYPFQRERYWLQSAPKTAQESVETELWDAIESLDVEALTATLQADNSQTIDILRPALPILANWRQRQREQTTIDNWRYHIHWTPLPDAAPPHLDGTWLVLAPKNHSDHPAVQTTIQALEDHGATALLTDTPAPSDTPLSGIISLLALDETPHPDHPAIPTGLATTIELLQNHHHTTPLWCLTTGAVTATPTDTLPHPAQAHLWGLGRVAALEHPHQWRGLIDLPTTLDRHTPNRLAAVLAHPQPEDQLAIRASGVLTRRLTRAPQRSTTSAWRPEGTTLITGGTGGLGAHIARWLTANGAPHIILASRQGPNAPGANELQTELGDTVTITTCDVSDRDALRRLLDEVPAEHPLTAVFHAAGRPESTPIEELDPAHVEDVIRPKAFAAGHLHELTRDLDLKTFVLFSSNAATWGSGRQASYAAANTYLDALAEHRRAQGLPATSIAWGPWSGEGMAADEETLGYLTRRGVSPLESGLAIRALQDALDQNDATVTVANLDWEKFPAAFTAQRPSPLLSEISEGARENAKAPSSGDEALLRLLADGTPEQQHQIVVQLVRTRAATVLGHSGSEAIPAGRPLQELGLDSLTAVELRNRLTEATGLQLPPSLVFDYPTVNALATHLREELTGERSVVTGHAAATATNDEPIAIIGMACRFPGGARSPQALWNLVASGHDAISEWPTDRGWNTHTHYNPDPEHRGTSYTRHGGFLHDAAHFDAAFFGISPREALAMDPQQRLLLETAWETIENAGINHTTLQGTNTGIYAGVSSQDYLQLVGQADDDVEGHLGTGNIGSVVSGRVAYTFGLEGPAVSVDTACSSSLVATHFATQALRNGECDLALAGGVTIMATPGGFIEFSRQRGLAADGRCKPFSAAADGLAWGEGAGLVLLERLSDARRNGHRVLAVIRGSAVNQDGASNGLTAPNGPSQQRVIRQALANARLSPSDVDAVEAHGTGTTLGDPIEAQALLATYGQDRPDDRPLWLGSIKSNIGHTQAAAGIAGVIKMVMAMRHGRLPSTLHVDEPSPHVDWSPGTVRLLTESQEWTNGERPRRAGVSSFGISGTNAHVVLESAPAPEPVAPVEPVGPVPWVLSARTPQALRDQARALADLEAPDIAAVARALVDTRATFEHRAVVFGRTHQQLRTGLAELTEAPDAPAASTGPLVWLFPGQGSQRPGMGAGLYERYPVFAAAFDQVCALLDPHLPEHPLKQVVFEGEPGGLLDHTTYAQAGLFAVQTALARLLQSHDLHPDVVIGHSIGEITAAHIAGVLDLSDACRLVAARATLMGALPDGGAMATIHATPDELTQPPGLPDQVSIAAHNTPTTTVLSGPAPHITTLTTHWANQGRKTRTLTTSHAFHSPLMDPILNDFETAIGDLTYHPPAIPLISTLTGQPAASDIATPHYWVRQVRQPVQFHHALTHTDPNPTFLELGADPVLSTAVQHTLDQPNTITTLTSKRPDTDAYLHALANLHTTGTPINWAPFLPASTHLAAIELPSYPFQRERYWPRTASAEATEADIIGGWRYSSGWTRLPEPDEARLDGTWLVVRARRHEDHRAVQAVVHALEEHGATPLVGTELPENAHLTGIISLLGLDETPHPQHPAVTSGLAATAELVQALSNADVTAPLWCVTQGATAAASPAGSLPNPVQAQIWGLGRAAALEHPHVWGGLIDLPAELDDRVHRHLGTVLAESRGEDQIAIRDTGVFGRRIQRAPESQAATTWRPEGTTLITGGTGGLGAHIARWLTANGAPHIILASRQGPNAPGANELQTELGDTVTITTCDVSDRDALRDLIDQIPEERPLTTVIHAAGKSENMPIEAFDVPHVEGVVGPKAFAAGHLHELTRDLDLKTFVLFSSAAATWGGGRQGSYGAANAYLDALAEHRRAQGLPATSIAWGPWTDGGMAADDGALDYYRRRGISPLVPELAVKALQQALDHDEATVTIADVDWERFSAAFTAQRPSALLSELTKTTDDAAADADGDDAPPLRQLMDGAPPAQRRHALLRHVQTQTASVLGHADPDAVTPGRPFTELGFDSLTAIELRNRLIAASGLPLPPTLIFDHPSPEDVAAFLHAQLDGGAEPSAARMLSDLEKWDAACGPGEVDEAARRSIQGRLQTLLAKWSEPGGDADRDPAAQRDLETATADEIFDLISDEFGKA